jgi:TolA-binding protein
VKKVFIAVVALYALFYWVSTRYDVQDSLAFAKKNPDSKLSAPVEYYVGMAYYQRSEYKKAQQAFTALLEQHPTHYYAQRALVPLSEAAQHNFDWGTARDALQKYIDEYPNGRNAKLARQRLDLLNYNHPP